MGISREILFRGKSELFGWIEGWYSPAVAWGGHQFPVCIMHKMPEGWLEDTAVIPETVGQYTGLTDKNGRKIFEGDILVFCKGATYPYKVIWDGIGWKLIRSDGKRIKEAFECNEIHYVKISEVIGNIHDNPELIGGGANEAV